MIIRNVSNNFLVMMEPKSIKEFEERISIGSTELHYAGQVNYSTGVLSNHFSCISRNKKGSFVEYSGKDSKVVEKPKVARSVLMLYNIDNSIMLPTEDLIYKKNAIMYFSYDERTGKSSKTS